MRNSDNLIWIDLEMTGLIPDKDKIIEIATIITDINLNIISEGPDLVIYQNKSILDSMDIWNTNQHKSSGLISRVLDSKITESEAELQTINFLKNYIDKGKSPMCGNTVCQDRRFLYKYMPNLFSYFHYRNLDVSTLRELVKRWNPKLLNGFIKESKHLALYDIRDSIAELIYYRECFIKIDFLS
ncbi:oligoribonuclease [Candidatus Legionella polyplacis]|uniref:Oligoribonuclease n=1 Tax=Candidatus Legionella polyplacis TaxID=2005262 RepID=A0ABZ2GV47_9GAMM